MANNENTNLTGGATGFNNPKPFNNESYNTFNKNCTRLLTARFNEIKPINGLTTLAGDVAKELMTHNIQTLTIQNPFMGKVKAQVGQYFVPLSAMMPYNWDKMNQEDPDGEEVPENVNPNLDIDLIIRNCLTSKNTEINKLNTFYNAILVYLILNNDSLLANLGYQPKWANNVRFGEDTEKLLNDQVNTLLENVMESIDWEDGSVKVPGSTNGYLLKAMIDNTKLTEKREVLYKIMNGTYEITDEDTIADTVNIQNTLGVIENLIREDIVNFGNPIFSPDITRLLAFKLATYQYYTNDKIDEIHSAKEWLENMEALEIDITGRVKTYTVDGKKYIYDVFSEANTIEIADLLEADYKNAYKSAQFFINLFSYDFSLRKNDYFTLTRKRPLAVGDVTAPVIGSGVSAIDINKSIWQQKFLNAVNRASEDAYKYLKEIFGVEPTQKIPMPVMLTMETYEIGQEQTENTATEGNVGDTATKLITSGGNYIFEMFVDQLGEIVQILTFETDQVYEKGVQRTFDIHSKDDRFNPFMQHFGDQAVYEYELNGKGDRDNKYGYQTRYAEFKNNTSYGTGAFKTTLKNWYPVDNIPTMRQTPMHISRDTIRNQNKCIDDIMERATGITYDQYFHFICKFEMDIEVNSKQEKTPSLI